MANTAEKKGRSYYSQWKAAKEQILDDTKPGTILRNNPDYEEIMAAVKEEAEANAGSK